MRYIKTPEKKKGLAELSELFKVRITNETIVNKINVKIKNDMVGTIKP